MVDFWYFQVLNKTKKYAMHLFVHVFILGGSCDDGVIFVLLQGTQMANKIITWNAIQVQFHSLLTVLVTNLISILCWMPKTEIHILANLCFFNPSKRILQKPRMSFVLDSAATSFHSRPPGLSFYWPRLSPKFRKAVPGLLKNHKRELSFLSSQSATG